VVRVDLDMDEHGCGQRVQVDGVLLVQKRIDGAVQIDAREPTCVNKGNLHMRKQSPAREVNADRFFVM
jgi:hypothetical protein